MKNDGGPAFPTSCLQNEKYMDELGYSRTRQVVTDAGGLTMLDYFAAAALQGLLSNDVVLRAFESTADRNGETTYSIAARNAYHHAKAMLKERTS